MNIIIYHKDCMDGTASAFIAEKSLEDTKTLAVNYGDEEKIFELISKEDTVYFVDFSLKRDKMIMLSYHVNNIIVIDHHKTAQESLKGLENELENIEVIFDMNRSGAMLCFDYFSESHDLSPVIFEYIEDRDIWNWKLPKSEEVSEYLKFKVSTNDLDSFSEVYYDFNINQVSAIGSILLEQQNKTVLGKIKGVEDANILDIDLKVINATQHISEMGNAICLEYDKPALLYFIKDGNAICSLRSTDELVDVSTVAKHFGGGGHRNACGFTLSIEEFFKLIYK
jgi:uncharacterized protein